MTDMVELERQLDAFEAVRRRDALRALAAGSAGSPAEAGRNVNMHMHSFFSYNADGWSPSHLAWAARKAGLYAAGLCDFDVLDGLEEFLEASRLVGLRATVNLETRAYVPEYARVDINSPGEPGVAYIMGGGFVRLPATGSSAAEGLAAYKARAGARNEALVARINPHVPAIAIDYARDVLPLTPAGGATERHIIRAYTNKAAAAFPAAEARAGFWSRTLACPETDAARLVTDVPALEEAVRSRLAKRGGLGYEQPSPETFPAVDAFVAWVRDCGAIPMTTWLDGTSEGEADPDALLDCLTAKGCAAVNIVPDRNWNYSDPDKRQRMARHLDAFVRAARRREQPINIGTEMNKQGLPFVDDLDGPVLRDHRDVFRLGAAIMVGHAVLGRYADCGYLSERAADACATTGARNAFFAAVGQLPPLMEPEARQLEDLGPAKAFERLYDLANRTGAGPTR
jgi:hypothetical protein